jgi:hypothetical protein
MAVVLILDFPRGSMDEYRQVVERMDLGGRMPEGGLFHAAGLHDGGLRVIDVWTDLATFEAFRDAAIVPYAQAAGLAVPEVRAVDVREEKPGSNKQAEFVQVIRLPGLDAESFAAADARVLPDGRPPQAVTFHVNGPVEGGWCVVDAWDSKEARDRFLQERIVPATADAPLTGPPQIEEMVVEATLGAAAPAHA